VFKVAQFREFSVQEEGELLLVQSSIRKKLAVSSKKNIFLHFRNNQAHSGQTTAHAATSPSSCIEISLPYYVFY
jgi:hypothetical protein